MSDSVDRQAAIDAINSYFGFDGEYGSAVQEIINGLPSAQQWIPCSEKLPERIIDGNVETVQEFFVTVKERWPGEEWIYHTDIAEFPGDYIDDIWQTYNDWREGQEVHVIAWMPLPEPYKEVENGE